MANYIFSYDLNGKKPTHEEMDEHIESKSWSSGRILETVWYIGTEDRRQTIIDHLASMFSDNDSYMLVDADQMNFQKLLVDDNSLIQAWARHA